MRLALLLCLAAAPALAEGLDDRHLAVIPRTAADDARIAAALEMAATTVTHCSILMTFRVAVTTSDTAPMTMAVT